MRALNYFIFHSRRYYDQLTSRIFEENVILYLEVLVCILFYKVPSCFCPIIVNLGFI